MVIPACGPSDVVTIHGAGATFPEPFYKRLFREYYDRHPRVRVSYQGIGSGAGINQFSQGLVDFGASDSAMTPEEIRAVPRFGVQLLPLTSGFVVLAYNLPGVKERIRLPREVYPKIFLGTITEWNDATIASANPGVDLPRLPIILVRRSEGSGTTFVLTNHLSAISPDWKAGPGVGKSIRWPTDGIGSKGNSGVAFTVGQTPGALGYLEYSYVVQSQLKTAVLENKAGSFVAPSIEGAGIALAGVTMTEDLIAWIPDPKEPGAYPIVSYSWIICRKIYEDPAVGEVLRNVLLYGATEGQAFSRELGYVPLPDAVAKKVRAAIESIQIVRRPAEATDFIGRGRRQ
jgi:phosphate transport system substrate-binding protein